MRKTFLFCTLSLLCLDVLGQSLVARLDDVWKYNVPLICGHRGGFYDSLPENSLSAIRRTYSNSLAPVMVEFDLRKSIDGTLFLMHDETVNRTTNGQGKISELTDAYLKSLVLRNAIGELTSDSIPTFNALLTYASGKDLFLMLDIKADVWKEAVALLKDYKAVDRSIVLTFDATDTKRVYGISPDVLISCLIRNESDWEEIERLSIPNKKLVAYVNDKMSENVRQRLKSLGVPTMMDVSEHTRNGGKPLGGESYRSLLAKMKSGILITDFPVDVSIETTAH